MVEMHSWDMLEEKVYHLLGNIFNRQLKNLLRQEILFFSDGILHCKGYLCNPLNQRQRLSLPKIATVVLGSTVWVFGIWSSFFHWQSAYKDQIIYPALFSKAENEIQTSSLLHEKYFPSLIWEMFYFLPK